MTFVFIRLVFNFEMGTTTTTTTAGQSFFFFKFNLIYCTAQCLFQAQIVNLCPYLIKHISDPYILNLFCYMETKQTISTAQQWKHKKAPLRFVFFGCHRFTMWKKGNQMKFQIVFNVHQHFIEPINHHSMKNTHFHMFFLKHFPKQKILRLFCCCCKKQKLFFWCFGLLEEILEVM